MNTKLILKLLFISVLVSACKKELEPQESSGVTPPPVAENAAAAPATPTATIQPNTPQMAQTAVTTAAGMNPAHGQPNHRCDIAVGAPLNSPPGKAPAATTAPQPAMTINPAQMTASNSKVATPVKTAPGMNPPHGQPNHRCDIAVGAPLNSPAGKTATPDKPTMTIDPSKNNAASGAPALLKGNATPAAATPVVTAPGMNPPHGQDGHRCDIAVGAALPKS